MHATLLVVESDHESGQVLSMYLEQQSYRVVWVTELTQARDVLVQLSPAVLLIDLDDPEQGWPDFYRWLREESKEAQTPCIWIASQFSEMALHFARGEYDYLLQKPLDPNQFLDLVGSHADPSAHVAPRVTTTRITTPKGTTASDDPSVDVWVDSLRGRMIGSVILEKEVGRGGMGVVFQGRQTSLHRKVAVKIMLPHLTKKLSTVERFQREALATARLKSPHIVQIFEAGTTDDQLFFIVMEWLEGETLEARIQREEYIPAADALDLMMQITSGLMVAHEAGLIHRDLKSSNIIVSDRGHVSITDFGLVYNQHTPRHTQSGIVVGTPHYLSPEQASGQRIDVRSDIYALGILFFELLTGQVPFQSNNLTDLLIAHIQTPLPDPRLSVSEIPDSFIPVLNKMAAKKPENRYQSAYQLCQSLQRLALSWRNAPAPSPAFAMPAADDPNGFSMGWSEPQPLGKDHDLLRTQIVPPVPALPTNQSSILSTGDLSHHEFYRRAASLAPSSLTPSSPHWSALQMQGMMLVDQQGNLLRQEGAVQAYWHSALAVLLGHAQQIKSAVELGSWEYSVLQTPYASLFVMPKDNHQILAIVRPPREHNPPAQTPPPPSHGYDTGTAFSRMMQSLHALAGVSNILLYDLAVQLVDARLDAATDPHDYPLKISPIIHMMQAIPWEQASLTCRFSHGLMRFWPMNGAFLCVQTTSQCNQSLLSMMVQRQSAVTLGAPSLSGTTPAPPSSAHVSSNPSATQVLGIHQPNMGRSTGWVSSEAAPSLALSALSPLSMRELVPVTPSVLTNPDDCLSSEVLQELTMLFTRFVGPIGKMVVSKAVRKMGFDLQQFPAELTPQLLAQLTSRVKESKRTEFTDRAKSLIAEYNATAGRNPRSEGVKVP